MHSLTKEQRELLSVLEEYEQKEDISDVEVVDLCSECDEHDIEIPTWLDEKEIKIFEKLKKDSGQETTIKPNRITQQQILKLVLNQYERKGEISQIDAISRYIECYKSKVQPPKILTNKIAEMFRDKVSKHEKKYGEIKIDDEVIKIADPPDSELNKEAKISDVQIQKLFLMLHSSNDNIPALLQEMTINLLEKIFQQRRVDRPKDPNLALSKDLMTECKNVNFMWSVDNLRREGYSVEAALMKLHPDKIDKLRSLMRQYFRVKDMYGDAPPEPLWID